MNLSDQLLKRSENKCELCESAKSLELFEVLPQSGRTEDNCIMICDTCRNQIENKEPIDSNHWRCLTTSMWSEIPGVKVVSWRMLNRLKNESWAQDSLDMIYLDDDQLNWAKSLEENEAPTAEEVHKDANGNVLNSGDTVVLIKSLDVKGSYLTAKIGTVIKNIRIVADNTDQIEGKVEGQQIVILTKFVRKQN